MAAGQAPMSRQVGWRPLWALAGLALLLRVAVMQGSGAGLHVDEAQYWWWSTSLRWGYFSKPPMIAALIAASTALFGDGLLGVRLLVMACWPASALVMATLASEVAASRWPGAADSGTADRAAWWTAGLWLATPLAGLLGLVATTDGPLVLCWSSALWLSWRAAIGRRPWAWPALGLALGAGLLSKYTMAALLPGLLPWLWWHGRAAARIGLPVCLLVALLCLAPHLAWNLHTDWQPWRHVWSSSGAGSAGALSGPTRAALMLAGQVLALGPLTLVLAWRLRTPMVEGWRRPLDPLRSLVWAAAAPLLLMTLLQAFRGRVEINWPAPMHLVLVLLLGLAAAEAPQRLRSGWRGLWLAQMLAVALLALAPAAWQQAQPGRWMPAVLDPWGRMRGWGSALAELAPRVDVAPGTRLLGTSRAVLAQALYAWRGRGLRPVGWLAEGEPAHHFATDAPWSEARTDGSALLIVSEGPLPSALAAELQCWQVLGQAWAPRSDKRFVEIHLLRGAPRLPAAAVPVPGVCP